jgi:trk system potassium uptake protein TrkA
MFINMKALKKCRWFNMYVIIVGAGRLGFHLAKILQEEGNDIVIVEKKGDKCHEISNELECIVIRGDGTKPHILEEAGVGEADAVVALTGVDETNLIVCLVAKQIGAKSVAARLGSLHYEEDVLQKLGLDLVIYPEAAAAGYIAELLTKPEVLDLAFIARGDAEILEFQVEPKSQIAGKRIKDVEHPQGTAIIGVYEKNQLIIPHPETEIQAGDKILIIAKLDKIKSVKKIFGL